MFNKKRSISWSGLYGCLGAGRWPLPLMKGSSHSKSLLGWTLLFHICGDSLFLKASKLPLRAHPAGDHLPWVLVTPAVVRAVAAVTGGGYVLGWPSFPNCGSWGRKGEGNIGRGRPLSCGIGQNHTKWRCWFLSPALGNLGYLIF